MVRVWRALWRDYLVWSYLLLRSVAFVGSSTRRAQRRSGHTLVAPMAVLNYRKMRAVTSSAWLAPSSWPFGTRCPFLVIVVQVLLLVRVFKVVTHFSDQGSQVHIATFTANDWGNIAPIIRLAILSLCYYLDKILYLCLVKQIIVLKELLTHLLIDIYLLAAVVFRLLAKACTVSA